MVNVRERAIGSGRRRQVERFACSQSTVVCADPRPLWAEQAVDQRQACFAQQGIVDRERQAGFHCAREVDHFSDFAPWRIHRQEQRVYGLLWQRERVAWMKHEGIDQKRDVAHTRNVGVDDRMPLPDDDHVERVNGTKSIAAADAVDVQSITTKHACNR